MSSVKFFECAAVFKREVVFFRVFISLENVDQITTLYFLIQLRAFADSKNEVCGLG